MTYLEKGDLLGHKRRKTDLLFRAGRLLRKMEYHEDQARPYRDWIDIIRCMDNPMQLLFGLFDSILSRKPEEMNKAEDRLGILLYQKPKRLQHAHEERTVRRAIGYFCQNSYNLAQKIEAQALTGNQAAEDRARNYARLTKRIADAFDETKLYSAEILSPLRHTTDLWDRIVRDIPVKVAHQDLTVATATKQSEPHVRV